MLNEYPVHLVGIFYPILFSITNVYSCISCYLFKGAAKRLQFVVVVFFKNIAGIFLQFSYQSQMWMSVTLQRC